MDLKRTLLTSLLLPALTLGGCDDASNTTQAFAPPPVEYSNYLVYIADGSWDPADMEASQPTLEQLQRETWRWSNDHLRQFEVDAKAFFLARFGIDVDDPQNAERLRFVPIVLDSRARYRVVTMANHEVPPEGWTMTDGSYQVFIDDPAGFELGGEFAGVRVPAGTFVTYGYYQIEARPDAPLVIGFQSLSPILPVDVDVGAFRCELWSDELGTGEAHGVYRLYQEPNGDVTFNIRNVLTFD